MQISQGLFDQLFLVMMFTAMGGLLWQPPLWILLTFFTPKKLLDTYFKEPHFSQGEVVFMSRFPLSLFRTSIFGWVLFLPSLDKKRKIRNCYEVMPTWYRIGLILLTISTMLIMFIFFGIMFFLLTSHITNA
ncbi:hypothetical protein MSP8887_02417 [Marinomonas spartinae]|uniref:hypothetical protein n=1 Tax=Marinomonas spartinae TaxID=1792290 RepID=UPI000808CD76|nr:hypothetical protein [Marinomonas spartinae]SBS35573.1 hypothetical protein MSP8887_02417 [Marinomonas spartinae]